MGGGVNMIILEGPDNSGKSHLASNIAEEYNLELRKSPGPDFSWKWVEKQYAENKLVVYDRFPLISDHIYGPILRNKDIILGTIRGIFWLNTIKEKKHLIIYSRPPKNIIKNFEDREDMEGVHENIDKIISSYDSWISILNNVKSFNIMKYDYTKDKFKDIKGVIEELWNP